MVDTGLCDLRVIRSSFGALAHLGVWTRILRAIEAINPVVQLLTSNVWRRQVLRFR